MRRAFLWSSLVLGLAGLVTLYQSRGPHFWRATDRAYTESHRRLLDSFGPTRPIEARLAGEASYKPYRLPSPHASRLLIASTPASASVRGGPTPEVAPTAEGSLPPTLVKAIVKAGERDSSPESQASLAVLNLVDGSPVAAIQLLRKALSRSPTDVRLLNDLVASLLVVSNSTGDPWPTIEAVDLAKRAEEMEPTLPVLFNLALALERLGLRARAIVAWKGYLDRDSRSLWAKEAGQRLDRLQQELAESPPQLPATPDPDLVRFEGNPWANRQLGERVLLSRWAEKFLAGRAEEAEAALSQAEALALDLTPDAGRLLTASIAAIREAEQSGDHSRLDLLARGHKTFGKAFQLYRQERANEAKTLLTETIRDFQLAKTPFELRARVLQAWAVTDTDWYELLKIREQAEARGFEAAAAEVLRIAGYRLTLQGRLEAASDVYQDSQQRFAALGEQET